MTDPIVDAVCAKLKSRSAVGIKKYGTTLADNPATVKEKLVHIQEELMDAANYVEWLLQEKEMPTPMTIEMEADERQSALDAMPRLVYDPIDNNTKRSDILLMSRWLYVHAKTIRAALQSPRVPVIEKLDEAIEKPYAMNLETGTISIREEIMSAARAYAELQKGV